MKKISSKYLFITKYVFPFIWFGLLAFAMLVAIRSGLHKKTLMVLVGPCFMAIFGFFLMKKFVWDLADEVYDCGDYLLVRHNDEEETVPLSNIMNVSVSMYMNPQRITLRLITPGKFGEEISFCPATPLIFNPFAKIQAAEDLIVRVHKARSRHPVQ